MADGARPGGDEHARALRDAREQDRLVGGIGWNAEARSGVHAGVGGQRHGLFRRQHDRLRGGTEGASPLAVPNPDALAHPRRRNAFAHLLDLARAVAVRNDARKGDLAR